MHVHVHVYVHVHVHARTDMQMRSTCAGKESREDVRGSDQARSWSA